MSTKVVRMSIRAEHLTETQRKSTFLNQLGEVVEANLQNDQFSVEKLADQMSMSRSNLHRKLKQASGQSANQFIREYRLERAMDLLKEDKQTVTEIAYAVGFSSQSYFTNCFSEYYGYPPGEAKFRTKEVVPPSLKVSQDADFPNHLTKKLAIAGLVVLALLFTFSVIHSPVSDSVEKAAGVAPPERSVAVLPLKNLNLDQEYAYFSEGVVVAINRHLSQVKDLVLISPLSTERYQEHTLSARQIGEELQVANLLVGNIQRHDENVRIEVRLVDTQTERQIWAENYDRQWQDILEVQGDIALQVAQALQTELPVKIVSEANPEHSVNPEAYDLYLKGNYELGTFNRSSNHKAIKYFQQAMALDPDFALPYVGMAHTYVCMASVFQNELSPQEAFALTKPQLDKALELDPNLPEARMWNGYYFTFCQWDFTRAEMEYQKAIATDNPTALDGYAEYLQFVGRNKESLEIARRSHESAPFFPHTQMIYALYYTGEYQEAEEFAQTRLQMFNNFTTLEAYGFLKLNTGQYEEAIPLFEQAMELAGLRNLRLLAWMGAAYARVGQPKIAQELIQELREKLTTKQVGAPRFYMAVIYSALGDKVSALEWLQQAYEQREIEMPWLMSEPQFNDLHAEPAFQELADSMGFPNAPEPSSSGLLTSTK